MKDFWRRRRSRTRASDHKTMQIQNQLSPLTSMVSVVVVYQKSAGFEKPNLISVDLGQYGVLEMSDWKYDGKRTRQNATVYFGSSRPSGHSVS